MTNSLKGLFQRLHVFYRWITLSRDVSVVIPFKDFQKVGLSDRQIKVSEILKALASDVSNDAIFIKLGVTKDVLVNPMLKNAVVFWRDEKNDLVLVYRKIIEERKRFWVYTSDNARELYVYIRNLRPEVGSQVPRYLNTQELQRWIQLQDQKIYELYHFKTWGIEDSENAMLATESALSEIWDQLEEDEAWAHL